MLGPLYPPSCASCRLELDRGPPAAFCDRCLGALEWVGSRCPTCGEPGSDALCLACRITPPPFERARAVLVYRDGRATAHAIQRWKYGGDQILGDALAAELCARMPAEMSCYDLVVPVPTSRQRRIQRGFDHVAGLARAVAVGRGEYGAGLLRRRESTAQAGLGLAGRARNARGAFGVARPDRVATRSVLLVDDVFTSGATARACAHALRRAGATLVDVLTLAHTARRHA